METQSSSVASNLESSCVAAPFKLPSPYQPCIHAASELSPIAFRQMKPETHHRGKQIVVRVFMTQNQTRGLTRAIVVDEKRTQSFLRMYHQPSETARPEEQFLRRGCYLIKEPFLNVAVDGGCSLRVDHPSDILLLSLDHELVPAKWRKTEPVVEESSDVRMKGNDAVGKKRWAEAVELYTTAVRIAEKAEESQVAYLNRSLANLRLGRPAIALADAIKSSGADGSAGSEKGLFREASALYALAKYDQCLDRLQTLTTTYPGNTSAMQMIDRVQERLREQQTGQYDFHRMYKQARATPPLIDCGTYTVPVEIRDSPGKGRGVFTTRKVLAGELLICEKAFGYIYGGKDHPDSRGKTVLDVHADLVTQMVQKMFHNIEDARLVGDLYHGDYDAVSSCEVDGKPVVDSWLVQEVVTLTNYRSPRNSLLLFGESVSGKRAETNSATAGVWSFISHINHSCIGNIWRSFIGDMQIIRATRDLEAGAELLGWYNLPQRFESYEDAQKRLSGWGFTCNCALCLDRMTTPEKVFEKRASLSKELDLAMGQGTQAMDAAKAKRTLDQLNETYSAGAREPGAVRLELWNTYYVLGHILNDFGRPSEAIEMILTGLEALGFIISAHPRASVTKSSRSELRIRQWGMASTFLVDAFQILHRAYKKIAPENSKAARNYMEDAYSMVVGEKDTFLETYPDLR